MRKDTCDNTSKFYQKVWHLRADICSILNEEGPDGHELSQMLPKILSSSNCNCTEVITDHNNVFTITAYTYWILHSILLTFAILLCMMHSLQQIGIHHQSNP